MPRVYDNWERLVGATLRREELRVIALRTPSEVSSSSKSLSSSAPPPPPPRRLPIFDYPNSSPFHGNDSFTYRQILQATDDLRPSNLIKKGHAGNLFYGTLDGIRVVVRQVDTSSWYDDRGPLLLLLSELEIFGRFSHPRLVPLVGHCFENVYSKFLVYKYIPNKDLSNCLFINKVNPISNNFWLSIIGLDNEVEDCNWSCRGSLLLTRWLQSTPCPQVAP